MEYLANSLSYNDHLTKSIIISLRDTFGATTE